MINVILCGGNGTRLWPLSRKSYPKQFCKLIDEYSLFQNTVERNSSACSRNIIVTNDEQYFLASDQLEEINVTGYQFILEPVGRNTAPAITLACLCLNEDDIILVTPSDHQIDNTKEYADVLIEAEKLAGEGYLVTFGVKPNYPETGFGYIEAKGNDVVSFKEKPDLETAEMYLEKDNYYWNSGMFAFRVSTFIEEMEKYSPDILAACRLAYENAKKDTMLRIHRQDMQSIPSNSIDYALMEKSDRLKVVPASIDWSDLGSFEALYDSLPKDENNNIISYNGITLGSSNNLILSDDRLITAIDVSGLVVVDTPDALLISKKGSSHKIKDIIGDLEKVKPEITKTHVTGYRPWGNYTILEEGYRYKIKKILVKPGKRLSLQKHYHRNEHWTVVNGTAVVTVGDKEMIVRANESIYIPMGELHRLENPGKIDLVIIETQVGDYLKEDDIVRIQDDYSRE